ncbi:MAG: type II toxin-antitoxin system RelE/ParE family toxin [Spirochaetales bacterium]|nr:type II toxin-antitoxin system RelE/ParE family toxin [Spirochaetales bacterium]
MVEIFWTDESKKWLGEIYDYISEDNPANAKKVILGIIDTTKAIQDFPSIGQKLLDWPDYNIRMLLYGHYRIVYHVKSDSKIDILGVYHGALDLKRHLKI